VREETQASDAWVFLCCRNGWELDPIGGEDFGLGPPLTLGGWRFWRGGLLRIEQGLDALCKHPGLPMGKAADDAEDFGRNEAHLNNVEDDGCG